VQMLLNEIASDTLTIQSLRSEFEERKRLIESKLEEFTTLETCSDVSLYTIPFHQSIASATVTSMSTSSSIHSHATHLSSLSTPRCHRFDNLNFYGHKDDPTYTIPSSFSCQHSTQTSKCLPPTHIEYETKMSKSSSMSVPEEKILSVKSPPESPPLSQRSPHYESQSSDVRDWGLYETEEQPAPASVDTDEPSTTSSKQRDANNLEERSHPHNDIIPEPVSAPPPTLHLTQALGPTSTPIVTPLLSNGLEPPTRKQKDAVRIIAQNCRGAFHSSKKHTDFYIPCMESLQGYDPDVICLNETNTDWNVKDHSYDVALMNRAIWSPIPSKTVVASCKWKNVRKTTYQPGGVLTTCMQSMPSRIKTTFRDPLGRFTKLVFQAKGNRDISLYNVYRPNPGSPSTSGIDTVWMQQWVQLKDDHDPCDPRRICITELINQVQKDLEKNVYPILLGDFNEDISKDTGYGIKDLMSSCNLVQAYQETLGFIPSSRQKARSVFHVLVYRPLLKYVTRLGILPTESGFHTSDHVPLYVDFHKDLFDYKESPIVSPDYRKLKVYDSPSVEKYVCYVKNQMHHHNILSRFLNLQDYIKIYSFDESAELELELLDSQMTQIRLRAEKKLKPSPSRFKNATKMQIQVHRIRHLVSILKFWKAGLPYSNLVKELNSYDLNDVDLSSVDTLQKRIAKERMDLRFLHEEEDVVRNDHLEYLYEKAMEIQNKKKASIIKNMKMRENQKRSWSKIRYVTRNGSNRNVERLGIPKGYEHQPTSAIWEYLAKPTTQPEFVYTNDPIQIERRLVEWQQLHYAQAGETPLASPSWTEALDPCTKTDEEIEQIMTGQLFSTSTLPRESKDFLHEMTSNIQPEMSVEDISIPDIVFQKFYKGAKESTSSSPSGLHLGHWKVGAADKDICMVLAGIVRLSVQNTYTLSRWRKVVAILMEKLHGQPKINKFRTIHLLESDLNFVLRYIWGRQFMRHNESTKAWHPNQYGSRKGIQGQSATLNKVLTLDVIRYYAEPAAIVDNDAKACYDRLIPCLLSYALMRLGLPKQLTRFMCKWLDQAQYFIKTSQGISKHHYSSTVEQYLYGTGQGTGWSPPNWGAISDIISTAMSKNTPGMRLTHPHRLFFSDRSFDAFVDDVNGGLTSDGLYAFHPSPSSSVPLLNTIYAQIQANVQYYSRLLFSSGGKLALDKCRAYLLEFQWRNGSRHMMPTASKYNNLEIDQCFNNEPDTIKLLDPHEARKMLGAYTAPDGNCEKQYQVLYEISKKWGQRVANGYLNRFDVQNSFKLGLIPALQYPLGVGVLSEHQCDQLLVPAMSTLLNKMGVVRSVNRDIVHSPFQYGGFSIPNLYTIQGYHKVQMVLGHLRKMDVTGEIITIAIATVQQEIGITQSFMLLRFSSYEYLVSPCWIKEVWRFIDSISGRIRMTKDWVPLPTYSKDINLMETVMSWDIPNSTKRIINLCRLKKKVYFLGDLYETNGKRFKTSIFDLKSENYHDDKFPVITLPKSYQAHWDFTLRKLSNDYPSANKLGVLIKPGSFKFRMTQNKKYILEYDMGERVRVYIYAPSTWKEMGYRICEISPEEVEQDYFVVTVDECILSTLLKLKNSKAISPSEEVHEQLCSSFRLNAVVQDTSELESTQFRKLLDTYNKTMRRNIGRICSTRHIRQLANALVQGNLIGVGDASVANDMIGHAFILETKSTNYSLIGVAPVDCVVEDQTSNRGESFTVLAMCTIIHALCKFYGLKKGAVTIYCDNKEALRRKRPQTCTFTTLSGRDVDVKMSVEYMINKSPISFSFEHVPGHADDNPAFCYDHASQQVQRNIDMHNLVTKFMKHPPPAYLPSCITPYLPHQNAALLLHGQVIAGDIQQHINLERHGLRMEERLWSKRHILHEHQHIIDWAAFRLAIQRQDTLGKIMSPKSFMSFGPRWKFFRTETQGCLGFVPDVSDMPKQCLMYFNAQLDMRKQDSEKQ